MNISQNYELWYIANGSPSAENAHQLLADVKNGIALRYADTIKYSDRQLAEGILNMMEFDTNVRKRFQRTTKSKNKVTAEKVHDRRIEHIHEAKGDLIRSAWLRPTPNAEEIADELAGRFIRPEIEETMKDLQRRSNGTMTYRLADFG